MLSLSSLHCPYSSTVCLGSQVLVLAEGLGRNEAWAPQAGGNGGEKRSWSMPKAEESICKAETELVADSSK